MKRLLTLLLLTLAVSVRGATGDILGGAATDYPGGMEVYAEGLPTNSILNNGLLWVTNVTTTNSIRQRKLTTTNALYVALDSWGYRYGTNYVWRRTNYATKLWRKPYPDNAQSDIVTNGGSPNIARIKLWMSDYVFSSVDSNLVLYATTNAFQSNAAIAALSITNNSDEPAWSTKANWLMDGRMNIRSTTFRWRAQAASHYKIDSVFCIFTDTNGLSVTNVQFSRRLDPSHRWNNGARIGAHYWGDADLSTLAAGPVTMDLIANPKIGTPYSTYVTGALFPPQSPQCQRLTNLYNPTGSLTTYIAVVRASDGNDSTGAATNVPPEQVNPAHYFFSGPVASRNCLASNSYNGATVYWYADKTNVAGTATYAQEARSAVEWRPYPGESFSIKTNTGSSLQIASYLKIADCLLNVDGATTTLINNMKLVSLTNCVLDNRAYPFRATTTNFIVYAEDCFVIRQGGGFNQFSSEELMWKTVGLNLGTFTNGFSPYLAVANFYTNTVSTNFVITYTGATFPSPFAYILYYGNEFRNMHGNPTIYFQFGDSSGAMTNCSIVNNVFEGISLVSANTPKSGTIWTAPVPMTQNDWHNNYARGMRHQTPYNETGAAIKTWSAHGSLWDTSGWVTDNTVGVLNGTYILNWSIMNWLGMRGVVSPHTLQIAHGAAEDSSIGNFDNSGSTRPNVWWMVRSNGAYADGSALGAGNSNVRWLTESPTMFVTSPALYEFDLDGIGRSIYDDYDPPGPLVSGNAKRGGMFF